MIDVYIACPYSHQSRDIRKERFDDAAQYSSFLIKSGLIVYSPVIMRHNFSELFSLPYKFDYWKKTNTEFISMSLRVDILMMPMWENSYGLMNEFRIAAKYGSYVRFIDNETYSPVSVNHSDIVEFVGKIKSQLREKGKIER